MADYRKLLVWQRAHALALCVYDLTARFPRQETYGLTAQARQAAVSVAANLAEGSGRGSQAEFVRYCRISNGSLNELEYHILLARDLNYLDADSHVRVHGEIGELRRMITKFAKSLQPRVG